MTSAHKTDDGRPRTEAELAQVLADLIDPHAYPALAAVNAAETTAGHWRADGEALPAELSFGVDRFLDGVEAWVAAKGSPT